MTQTAEEIETLLRRAGPPQSVMGTFPWGCEDEIPADEPIDLRPTLRIALRWGKTIEGRVMSVGDRRKDKSHIAVWIESGALRFCYPVEFSLDSKDFSNCDIISAAMLSNGPQP